MGTAFIFEREPDVDQLVATYTALGRKRRVRRKLGRRIATAVLLGLVLGSVAWGVWTRWHDDSLEGHDGSEVSLAA